MKIEKWLSLNTGSLSGKTVAVTGSTGGIGRELCTYLLRLGARLLLLNRSREKTERQLAELLLAAPGADVGFIPLDLESEESVRAATDELKVIEPDVLIHNAGAYSIPRHQCKSGLDNVYQINFASPYYMVKELLPTLRRKGGRVVIVGSIAHNYSHIDENDIDFSTRSAASRVYGNAKRYLMFSLFELFRDERDASLSITHPGITFTNITSHYPPLIFALIKHPMKIIFMKPRVAALSVLRGVFEPTGYREWIGPSLFDVWGLPKKKRLSTASDTECEKIAKIAERVYSEYASVAESGTAER